MFGRKRKKNNDHGLRLIDKNAPFAYVEAYKALRTNVDYIVETNNMHTILITSPSPGDGKSTVSINLAVALQESGKKVLLLDCDMRKGSLSSYLKISRRTSGISAVLAGNKELKEVILFNETAGIPILPVGNLPSNPAEVIGSSAMAAMIQKVSEMYDYVIIDTPPVSAVTDAAVLSRQTDGVILVARADKTTRQGFTMSKRILDDVHAHIIGVVLNDLHAKRHFYGYGHYYSYSTYDYGSSNGSNKLVKKK